MGCCVSRVLLSWGIRSISFLDNAKLSLSNPIRQCLYTSHDLESKQYKAVLASKSIQQINPSIKTTNMVYSILIPENESVEYVHSLDFLTHFLDFCLFIDKHDVVFLLTDTRESRYLPSLLCCLSNKLCINIALGIDSLVVMRYGEGKREGTEQVSLYDFFYDSIIAQYPSLKESYPSPKIQYIYSTNELHVNDKNAHLLSVNRPNSSCYFCSDIESPTDSSSFKTMDESCTISRGGLAYIASGFGVELYISLLHRKQEASSSDQSASEQKEMTNLGEIPHQV